MPNWSSTKIEFTGDSKKLEYLKNKMMEKDKETLVERGLDVFSCAEPVFQDGYENSTGPDGSSITGNWYHWRLAHWGTKWNISDFIHMELEDNVLRMEFESAWSGPDIWFKKICEEFGFSGIYIDTESGVGFIHVVECKNGEEISDVEDDYISELSVSTMGKDWILDTLMWILDENYETEIKMLNNHDYLLTDLNISKISIEEFYEYAENAGYEIKWRKGKEDEL